jgi:hypothetical protein
MRSPSDTSAFGITDSILRRNDERNMGGLVAASAPGVMLISAAGYTYLASSRKGGKCWVAVYIHGVRIYDATMGMINRPDFNRIAVREYAEVEFYPGDASLPLQYSNRGSDCGTLLLWTRER